MVHIRSLFLFVVVVIVAVASCCTVPSIGFSPVFVALSDHRAVPCRAEPVASPHTLARFLSSLDVLFRFLSLSLSLSLACVLCTTTTSTVGLDGTVARLDSLDPTLLLVGEDDDGTKIPSNHQSTLLEETAGEKEPPKKPKMDPNNNNDNNDNDDKDNDTQTPAASRVLTTEELPTNADANANANANAKSSLDWDVLKTELEGLVGSEAALSTVTFLQESQDASGEDGDDAETPQSAEEYVVLPASSKDARRALHEWIRSRLEPVARSDTENGCVRLWLKRYEHKMTNYNAFNNSNNNSNRSNHAGGKRRRDSQESSAPGFLRFVLYKENMDTGTAMHQLQQSLQPPPSRHSNPRQRRPLPRVRLGFAGMKDKRGITSQFVTLALDNKGHRAPQIAENLCRRWNQSRHSSSGGGDGGGHTQSRGVGILRVGRFERVPDELRLGSLRGNRFDIVLRNLQEETVVVTQAAEALRRSGFVNYFGVQRFGKYHDTHLVGMAVLRGDYRSATDLILGPRPDEPDLVRQARLEWQNRFTDGPKKDGGDAEAERRCAQTIVKQFSRFMNTEVALLQSLARHPLDYQRAFKCIAKTMRMMFLHAVQSYVWNHTASHRLQTMGHDVVEGDLVFDHATASVVRLITKEDVDSRRYTLGDIVLPVIGTTTVDPSNSCGAFMHELLDKQQLSKQMFHNLNDRDLDVKGDYRKLLCHPTDVDFELLHYSDPLQPLVQTDLMLLQNLPVNTALNGENASLHAIRVGFTLPPSSYATIALRELLKRPTSSNYQSEQKLDNEKD